MGSSLAQDILMHHPKWRGWRGGYLQGSVGHCAGSKPCKCRYPKEVCNSPAPPNPKPIPRVPLQTRPPRPQRQAARVPPPQDLDPLAGPLWGKSCEGLGRHLLGKIETTPCGYEGRGTTYFWASPLYWGGVPLTHVSHRQNCLPRGAWDN